MSRHPIVKAGGGLTAAALLATGLVTGAAPALAAETTCQGRAATIVSNDQQVTGTEGPDVISTGSGTLRIDALGGDDLICAIAGTGGIVAGAGDDSILTSTPPGTTIYLTSAALGPGDDTYVGTAGGDSVDTGSLGPADSGGRDIISTGAGDDSVGSGTATGPNLDQVDLGDGNDHLRVFLPGGSLPRLVGGGGSDDLSIAQGVAGGAWRLDLGAGSLTRDGLSQATVPGFENIGFTVADVARFDALGTDADEAMYVGEAAPDLDVRLGGGADRFGIGRGAVSGARGRIDLGGQDGDALYVDDERRAVLDLADQRLVLRNHHRARYDVTGVQDADVHAADVVIDGDDKDNVIGVAACRGVAQGGQGSDEIYTGNSLADSQFTCAGGPRKPGRVQSRLRRTGVKFFGQRGKDDLSGINRPGDVLIGGPGRDRVDGQGGPDRCEAERRTGC